ncbi:MAG: hypothetical protein ACRERC_00060 [Candidatus Binatia bacterium]
MGALLGLAALIAALVLGLRFMRQRAVERAQPGRSPTAPIPVEDYGDMDVAVRLQTCRCGGRLFIRGEGPGPNQALRVAHLECRKCEREQALYFDLSTLRH